ncbi:MAG: hypothetical protein ACP5U1_05930 [Desulfomonilaceae bacterium]
MKRIIILMSLIVLTGTVANAELLEMAANCDQAITRLKEIIKDPNSSTPEKIRDAFGVDILDSCDSPDGKIVCFQCVDKNQKLQVIQLQLNKAKKLFEFKGFGCKCNKNK